MCDGYKETTGGEPETRAPIAPHAYWRTFAKHDYDVVRRLQLKCMLGAVSTTDAMWRCALAGDAASAVAIALTMHRPATITRAIDLRMSVLVNAALEGDRACEVVLANMLPKMPLGRDLRLRLAASWSDRTVCSPRLAPLRGPDGGDAR